jgi:hypothetical protein
VTGDFDLPPGVEVPEVEAYRVLEEWDPPPPVQVVWDRADAAIAALCERLNRLDSFDGHLEWLHEHYPETVFDASSRDVGAVNVVLSRKLLEAQARVAELEREPELRVRFDETGVLTNAQPVRLICENAGVFPDWPVTLRLDELRTLAARPDAEGGT